MFTKSPIHKFKTYPPHTKRLVERIGDQGLDVLPGLRQHKPAHM